ncbi:MAG: hypothetical protein AAF399_24305 [Bacteroidota bacterium]
MKNFLSLLFAIFLANQASFGQDGSAFLQKFDLAQSFETKESKAKPALITYTVPGDTTPRSALINAALGVDIVNFINEKRRRDKKEDRLFSLSPFIEYNFNSLIDKEQHQLRFGLSTEWIVADEGFIPSVIGQARYANDLEASIESFQSSAFFAPGFTGKTQALKNFFYPDNQITFLGKTKDAIAFEYIPYLGLESEHRLTVVDPMQMGDIVRAVGKVESNLSLFPVRKVKSDSKKKEFSFYRVLVTLDYQYRSELFNSTSSILESPHFLRIGVNFNILKTKEMGVQIGIDYVNGADPSKGFRNQQYSALSLKVKL